MDPLVKNIISACWIIFLVVWLLAAIFTKRTVYRESGAQRLRYCPLAAVLRTDCPDPDRVLSSLPRLSSPVPLQRPHHSPHQYHPCCRRDFMRLRTCLLFLGPGRSRRQLEWHGYVERKSRIDSERSVPAGPPSDLHRPACHGRRNCDATGTRRRSDRTYPRVRKIWIKLAEEEELMRKQFSDQYLAYEERVKRIVPFVL